MESKNLPVLYVPYDTDALTDKEALELTRACDTPFRGSFMKQEPFIPVSRVRERLALFAQAHGAVPESLRFFVMSELQKLIADVEEP